jgi:YHS domain-containing protein
MFVDADRAPARLPWGGRVWHFCSFQCAATFTAGPGKYASEDE